MKRDPPSFSSRRPAQQRARRRERVRAGGDDDADDRPIYPLAEQLRQPGKWERTSIRESTLRTHLPGHLTVLLSAVVSVQWENWLGERRETSVRGRRERERERERARCRFQYLSSHSANFGVEQCPLSHFHENRSADCGMTAGRAQNAKMSPRSLECGRCLRVDESLILINAWFVLWMDRRGKHFQLQ